MDARAQARLKIARRALLALRHRDFRAEFPRTNADNERVIIPGLLDDTMDMFIERFRAAAGPVYVVAPDDDGLAIMSFTPTHAPRHAVAPDDPCPFHPTTELGMVIELLKASGGTVRFYEAEHSPLLLQLV